MNVNEKLYLMYREGKAFFSRFVFLLFRILPIQNKKIVISVREGEGGYSCNPKAVIEEIRKDGHLQQNNIVKIVWLVNDTKKSFPSEIQVRKNTFLKRTYELATAKVWIDTHWKPYGTRKRKGQIYIQTWHGPVGFKAVGKLRGSELPEIARRTIEENVNQIDLFLSNSTWCTNIYRKAFEYKGNVIEIGSPRCDVFFKDGMASLKQYLNIKEETKVALYAPTLRGGVQRGKRKFSFNHEHIDFIRLRDTLTKRWGGEWYVLVRLHPHLTNEVHSQEDDNVKGYIDVSLIEDIYQYLPDVDVLISDYSSLVFDFSYMKKPVFLYSEDLCDYKSKRGVLWDLNELPFPYADRQDKLYKNIMEFDEEVYTTELINLHEQLELVERGHASRDVVELLMKSLEE